MEDFYFRTPLTLFQIRGEGVRQVITGQEAGVWKDAGGQAVTLVNQWISRY